jgi:hypothetical protein
LANSIAAPKPAGPAPIIATPKRELYNFFKGMLCCSIEVVLLKEGHKFSAHKVLSRHKKIHALIKSE